jgi:NTE family protein
VNFPRKGYGASLNIYDSNTALGAQDNYTKWDIDGTTAHTFGNHTFTFSLKAGGRIGSNSLPYYDQFQWGGFLQQSGYKTGQLYGENLSFGKAVYYHRIMKGTLLEGAYGGFSLEAGRVGNPLVPGSPEGLLKSGSLFVAADSPLGPAYLGYGRATDGNDSFYFYLGKQF